MYTAYVLFILINYYQFFNLLWIKVIIFNLNFKHAKNEYLRRIKDL
jgi:hypothetical protein